MSSGQNEVAPTLEVEDETEKTNKTKVGPTHAKSLSKFNRNCYIYIHTHIEYVYLHIDIHIYEHMHT
jgi:hypothetical protein